MVRQGMSVAPGMTLARINGLGTVWLEAALPESLAASIQPGQGVEARFPALPGEVIKGKVAAVLPEANRDTRTLRLRIELPNPGQRLKAGMFAQVSLRGAAREALVVPAEAVIRTGKRALVYLSEQPGRYRPVSVEIGEQVDDLIVVRSGLSAGQQVVASGQFLLDSEASLQGVMARGAPLPASAAAAAARRRGRLSHHRGDRRDRGGQPDAGPRTGAGSEMAGDDHALQARGQGAGERPEEGSVGGVQLRQAG